MTALAEDVLNSDLTVTSRRLSESLGYTATFLAKVQLYLTETIHMFRMEHLQAKCVVESQVSPENAARSKPPEKRLN